MANNQFFKDMKGQIISKLQVLNRVENDRFGNAMWLCKCECGNEVIVKGANLRNGKTKSCGCYNKEVKRNLTHGMSGTKIYKRWLGMKGRCNNKDNTAYANYGGRGITICDEWLDVENFINWATSNGYREDLTLERLDVNSNYNPENCVWVTRTQQNRNTRRNIKETINGTTYTLAEIARKVGVTRGSIYNWYHKEGLRGEELIKRADNVPARYK